MNTKITPPTYPLPPAKIQAYADTNGIPPGTAQEAPTERRLTIPVSLEVYETFARIAKAGKMPIGRAMGEWLADTNEAASFMAEKMEQARAAPALVARELHSYALGLTDMTSELMASMRKGQGKSGERGEAAAASPASPPRPVIRGGNLPKNTKNQGAQ